ncbi:hypothetical protein Pmar_PMAR015235 [Perkinsus marinus ATCC 50983]|uniref:Uncharacterized protein n=1 Tax=Perkinsus marinus (strain ATCC 50983 / TXsc) TaxID=423536 RepID=C5KL39_PERM5|nr:hypothetical protein Pmar_PMAR015235 [Perkinsus marinus ATCC 50983]EER14712.1 hypothetical protein Pmar_PMAR015235 [Perkinsus marinus ATCC 50983]|eukprot:XP_002782916.1 hypothetical protein Pmar_PMAR015235 [Perkinsus marinus ATCC 50983]
MNRMDENMFTRRLDQTLTRRLSKAYDPNANDGTLSPRSRAQLSLRVRNMNSMSMIGSSFQASDVLPFAVSPAPSSIIAGNRGALGSSAEDEEDTINRLTKRHIPWVALAREDVHRTKLEKYNMFISSPLYVVSPDQNLTLPFERDAKAVDIKVVAAKDRQTAVVSVGGRGEAERNAETSGRLLRWQLWYDPTLADPSEGQPKRRLAGTEEQVMLYTNSLPLATNVETEFFENVDLVSRLPFFRRVFPCLIRPAMMALSN